MVTPSRGSSSPRPAPGSGKTTVATGLMAALRRARARGLAAQGRARLHRPRLPRPGHRAARAATSTRTCAARSGSRRCSLHGARGRRPRRRRGRDGPVRRRRRARASSPPPRTWPSCCGRRWCWSWTPPSQARSVAALVHGFAVLRPAGAGRAGDPQPGRLRPARGAAARGAGRRRACRCSARCGATTRSPRRPGTSGWSRSAERRAEAVGAVARARRAGRRRRATWTRCCALARTAPPLRRPSRGTRASRGGRSGGAGAGRVVAVARRRGVHLLATPSTPSCSPRPGAEVVAVRPAARRGAARRHRRAGHRRRLPRGVRRRAVRQRAAARRRRRAGRRAARRSPPSAPGCSTWRGSWTDGPMCGVLDADGPDDASGSPSATGRRSPSPTACWPPAGTRVRGHEFHRTVVEPGAGAAPAWGVRRPGAARGGLRAGRRARVVPAPALGGRAVPGAAVRRRPARAGAGAPS